MISKPKGTYDVYGDLSKKVLYIENIVHVMMEKYNVNYIRTPLFESSDLFHRGIGSDADITRKETYDFKDRSDRSLTLKPEGTASVARMFIENKLYTNEFNKFYYITPCYRYERPQAGRFREFYQIGVEVLGSNSPMLDADIIALGYNLLDTIGIKNVTVLINTLGLEDERSEYKKVLREYFNDHLDDLCDDCKERLKTNVLRVLDCKLDKHKDFFMNAPKITDYLSDETKERFERVKDYLDILNIPYKLDTSLVRGLDYYNDTIFEMVVSDTSLGNQNVLCAGGRYDNLISNLDGPKTPAFGFGMGLERIVKVIEEQEKELSVKEELDIFVMSLDDESSGYALDVITMLRLNDYTVDTDYLNKSIKGKYKMAEKYNATYVVTIGSSEEEKEVVLVKDMLTKEEDEVAVTDLIEYFEGRL